MNVVVIKYNAGNIQSVLFALERLQIHAVVSDDSQVIAAADRVIFPGVGEASSAMNYLRKTKLDSVLCSLKQPVLGICLGMQLLCSHSEENDTECLHIISQQVNQFPKTSGLKIPQIGWNTVENLKSPLFHGIAEKSYCYFVHGYYVAQGEHTIATANYGVDYSAALQKDNFFAVQFHPEKSGEVGARILRNFIEMV